MKLYKIFVAVVSLTLSLTVLATSGSKQYSPESAKLLSNLQGQIKATLLAISDNERRAGKSMHDFHFLLSVPAQEITYLGLVLELDNADNGYEVLSVTPGSAADKLSIKSKDRILKLNGIRINNSTKDTTLQLLNDLKPDDTLKLTVKSKNGQKELTTKLIGQYIPEIQLELGTNNDLLLIETDGINSDESENLCGRVSTFFTPPEANYIFKAAIHEIDDNHLKNEGTSYRLPIGKHTILIYPASSSSKAAKPIEVDVKMNATYYLGIKRDRTHNNSWKKPQNDRWTPVIWKKSDRECNL